MSREPFGLFGQAREELVKRFRGPISEHTSGATSPPSRRRETHSDVPESLCRFDRHPGYEKLLVHQAVAARLAIANPFFKTHEGVAGATTVIGGRSYINFSSYNYLGLGGHPRVNQAAKDAIDRYGTSASASRLVAGERPVQRELEEALAAFYDVEDCVVFVSGHTTNVSSIGYLFSPRDLVVHDSLIHNSVLEGVKLSGAMRRSFPHNDTNVLESILAETRGQYERVLIVVEGLYSMDGDIPDLPCLIDIKTRHKALLMVDEAHSLGVLGKTGRGLREHFGLSGSAVDIWMGTLSKTLAGCGGFIAGVRALVEHLKYAAPGFVYSVGISPPLAAASLEALRVVQEEPERIRRLNELAQYFLERAKKNGIDTGFSQGHAIIPAIIGSSVRAVNLSTHLFARGINVQPIIYPAVEERVSRLRFFINSMHSEQQVETAIDTLVEAL